MANRNEGPRQLDPSDEYSAAREALDPHLQRFVKWVEQDIQENPYHIKWRRPVGRSMIDYGIAGDGLLIRYRVVNDRLIKLEELINQRERERVDFNAPPIG